MGSSRSFYISLVACIWLTTLPARVLSSDLLTSTGFSACIDNPTVTVQNVDVQYNRSDSTVVFDVSGTSQEVQNVTASLTVSVYGKQVYSKAFDPCELDTLVPELCPLPAGNFAAQGSESIPAQYASMIPSIAFSIPNLEGEVVIELLAADSGDKLSCVSADFSNGKTLAVPALSYVAAGIAGSSLVLSGLSAGGAAAGTVAPSPSFGQTFGFFQSIAMSGMLSVNYPSVYRSFTQNFAFSGLLVPWSGVQTSIDNFRATTGGNITDDSYDYLKNATLVYANTTSSSSPTTLKRRGLASWYRHALGVRDISTSINGTEVAVPGQSGATATSTTVNSTSSDDNGTVMHVVQGIQAFVEELTIPQANTFMTVLLVFAIIVASITVGILLFKVILETWALFGSFPKKLTGFRKRYWGLLARTITNLILTLYGIWTMYCVYQFTNGDSWAAKVLAGVTLGVFTAILFGFTFRIWQLAHKYRKMQGDASLLYEDEVTWRRYSLFYDQYKKDLWWIFIPSIIYMFAKGCVIAGGDGHGLFQTGGQLILESLMFLLLIWNRPYATKAGNWINIVIQVVRVLSVVCILVFVDQLGISQSTKTITGIVLIAVQSALTGILAILIAINALIVLCKENPHLRRRKQAEKLRDFDDLTPLDARNSLLIDPEKTPSVSEAPKHGRWAPARVRSNGPGANSQDRIGLVSSAAPMGYGHGRSVSPENGHLGLPSLGRQPTLPMMEFK